MHSFFPELVGVIEVRFWVFMFDVFLKRRGFGSLGVVTIILTSMVGVVQAKEMQHDKKIFQESLIYRWL